MGIPVFIFAVVERMWIMSKVMDCRLAGVIKEFRQRVCLSVCFLKALSKQEAVCGSSTCLK